MEKSFYSGDGPIQRYTAERRVLRQVSGELFQPLIAIYNVGP
jgi:hypothetical protein